MKKKNQHGLRTKVFFSSIPSWKIKIERVIQFRDPKLDNEENDCVLFFIANKFIRYFVIQEEETKAEDAKVPKVESPTTETAGEGEAEVTTPTEGTTPASPTTATSPESKETKKKDKVFIICIKLLTLISLLL